MSLIIEDGTIVSNANSYVTIAEIREFALQRGISLPVDDADIEILSTKAIDYLESKRNEYQGIKVINSQSLQFPRMYLVIDGFDFPSWEIPSELKKAQSQLILELHNGINVLPTFSEAPIKKETIGPLTTEYAVGVGEILEPTILSVDALLKPLLKEQSSGFSIKTLRV